MTLHSLGHTSGFVALGTLLLLACGSASADPRRESMAVDRASPVIVELFQSQGCSSCPPANAYLNKIADRGDVVALSFAVTYWDRLGWKDTFAKPAFTQRQRDYAQAGTGQVATPEVVVNGTAAVVGADPAGFTRAIARATLLPATGPAISFGFTSTSVRIGAGVGFPPARVFLIRYDPQVRQVPIRAGENSGRTLPHRGIVRELFDLGRWNGAALAVPLPGPSERNLAGVVIVQNEPLGAIIAAARVPT